MRRPCEPLCDSVQSDDVARLRWNTYHIYGLMLAGTHQVAFPLREASLVCGKRRIFDMAVECGE
jgi:hypothetical protein